MSKKVYLVEVKETYTYVIPTEATSLKKAKQMVVNDYNSPFVEGKSLIFAVDRANFADMTAEAFIPNKEDIECFICNDKDIFRGDEKNE